MLDFMCLTTAPPLSDDGVSDAFSLTVARRESLVAGNVDVDSNSVKAAAATERGDVVLIQRPLAALQLTQNRSDSVCCAGCHRFVGSLDKHLALAGGVSRHTLFSEASEREEEGVNSMQAALPALPGFPSPAAIPAPCGAGCGEVYCGEECRRASWNADHSLLCVGGVEAGHALYAFKLHAVHTHDTLLLAAQLLVRAICAAAADNGAADTETGQGLDTHGAEGSDVHGAEGREANVAGGNELNVAEKRSEAIVAAQLLEALLPRGAPPLWDVLSTAAEDDLSQGDGSTTEDASVAENDSEDDEYGPDALAAAAAAPVATQEAVLEAHRLLVAALAAQGVATVAYPTLLSAEFFGRLAGGLEVNCIEASREPPLVSYCERLISAAPAEQLAALPLLESVIGGPGGGGGGAAEAMENGEEGEEGEQDEGGVEETKGSGGGATGAPKAPAREGGGSSDAADGHLVARCARLARRSRVMLPRYVCRALPPPLSGAAAPAAGAAAPFLKHSCIPNCAVVDDPREYGGAADPAAPLALRWVALRPLAAGEPLTASFVEAALPLATRAALLAANCGMDAAGGGGGGGGGGSSSGHGGKGGCGCDKCRFESACRPGRPCSIAAAELHAMASTATQQHRYGDAAAIYDALIHANHSDGDAWHKRGVSAANQGDFVEAREIWERGLAAAPHHAELASEMARIAAYESVSGEEAAAAAAAAQGGPAAAARSQAAEDLTPPLPPPPAEAPLRFLCQYTSGGDCVVESAGPILSKAECKFVVETAEAAAAAAGGWTTARHYAVPTTDMPVHALPPVLRWFNAAAQTRIFPLVAAALAASGGIDGDADEDDEESEDEEGGGGGGRSGGGGTSGGAASGGAASGGAISGGGGGGGGRRPVQASDLRVHDAFVVRYDAAAQRSLPSHTDQSDVSLTIALNASGEYEGGGTWFEELGKAVRPEVGHVVAFPGHLFHAGHPITAGRRYIIAAFLYVVREDEEEAEE